MIALGVELDFSSERYFGVLTLRNCGRDLICRQDLYRGTLVKTRLSGWALIQWDWCHYEKGISGGTHMHGR